MRLKQKFAYIALGVLLVLAGLLLPGVIVNKAAADQHLQAEVISPKDGAKMVLIPAGEFSMGDHFDEGQISNDDVTGEEIKIQQPVHTVYLDDFYIDAFEVTVAMYQKFIDETGHRAPFGRSWLNADFNPPNHPVVDVDWHDAAAYLQWAGRRLPTEAEWDKAARGGLVGKRYPWGDEINHDLANYRHVEGEVGGPVYGTVRHWKTTAPVGSFPPNGYGVHEMIGNAWEWVMDEWDKRFYATSPKNNPVSGGIVSFVNDEFLSVTTPRVIRGASYGDGPTGFASGLNGVTIARRAGPPTFNRCDCLGFRGAADFTVGVVAVEATGNLSTTWGKIKSAR